MNINKSTKPLQRGRSQRPWQLLSAVAFATSLCAAGVAQAALTLDAVMHHDPARPGESLQLELTVTNTDAFARFGVTLTMAFPAGLNQLFETQFAGDCPGSACDSGETVTWLLGSLPAGGHTSVVLPAVISNATASGTVITFSPSVTDIGAGSDADSATVMVEAATRFDLAMSENRDPATPGDTLSYKITWGFRADSVVVTNSRIEFSLPAGTTFVSASDGGSSNGAIVTWPLGNLQPGQSGIREVAVSVDGGLATPAVVHASAQLINVATPSEAATARTGTVITSSSSLSLVVESNTNPARQGEYVNFNAIVTNNDPFTRFGVTLSARQPQDTAQLFETEFAGNCQSTACEPNEPITWTLGDLPAGASVSVDLPGRISTTVLDGVLVNLFMVVSDSTGVQTRQADTIRVQDDVRYDISLSEDADPVAALEELTYRVHFGYRADASAVSNSTLLFRLPVGTSFVSASDSGSQSGGIVTWSLGNLSPGQGGIRDVTVALDGALPASSILETWAEIQSLGTPAERSRAEAATSIAAASPLALTFESNTQPASFGELAQVQMTVTNNDPFTRFGVTLSARQPQDTAQLFETEFAGNCTGTACESNERVTWSLGDIPAGDSRSVDYPVVFSALAIDGVLVNFYAAAGDDQGAETHANDTVRIQSDALYDIALSENSDPASAGDTLRYQVTFGYREDAPSAINSRLRLALPDGVTFISASDGGVNVNNEVQWGLGTLSPGDGGQRTVEVAINGGLTDATVLKAEAIVEALASPLEHARARAATIVAASHPLALRVEANPKPGRAGEMANIQFVITNNDPFTRFGVSLVGRFPQNVNQLFETVFAGDCAGTACESGESVTWALGDIGDGGSRRVELPVTVSGAAIDGLLINFYLEASDDQGLETRHVDTIRVSSDNPYEVALSDDIDPAMAGDAVQYVAAFGYRNDAAMARDSELSLTLPAGMTPIFAGNSGVITGNRVTWPLGFLGPGAGGVRQVTATVDGGVAAGSILEARAHVHSLADPLEGARAEALTVVALEQPLSLSTTSTPNPAHAADQLLVQFSVTNNDPFSRFGVTLVNRYPQGVNRLFETLFNGDCPGTACESGEQITWLLGEVGPGQTVTVDLPPTVSASALDGNVIPFYAEVSDDTGVQATTTNIVRIGDPETVIDLLFSDSFEGTD